MWLRSAKVTVVSTAAGFFFLCILADASLGQQDASLAEGGARAVASYIDQRALLEDTVKNIGVNIKSPEMLAGYLEQVQQLKPGYEIVINWVSPGPVDPAIRQLFAEHVKEGVTLRFYEFATEDLAGQLQAQNDALNDPSHDHILRDLDPAIDPAQAREVSQTENKNIFNFFRRWQNRSADFAASVKQFLRADRTRSENLDLAGHALGLTKVAGLVGFWFFSGDNSGHMDMQTMAVAAAASGSGAYLAWLFTRYGPEWLEYRRNFKIVRTKIKIQWFSLMSWLRGGVALGSRAFLKVPGGQAIANWFNQTRLMKYLVIDAAVRGGLGAYFRLLAFVKGGAIDPPWSPAFWGEMASSHQDLLYSPAAESKLQQLYETGAISESVRWAGVQTWGFCIYTIQIVTDFGFKSFLWGRLAKGLALGVMVPTKLGTIVVGGIVNQPLSARGKYFAKVVPEVEPRQVRVTVMSAEYSDRDRATLEALNHLDQAIEANTNGEVDLKTLQELIATTREDPLALTSWQKAARTFYRFYEHWFLAPLRRPLYGACPPAFGGKAN